MQRKTLFLLALYRSAVRLSPPHVAIPQSAIDEDDVNTAPLNPKRYLREVTRAPDAAVLATSANGDRSISDLEGAVAYAQESSHMSSSSSYHNISEEGLLMGGIRSYVSSIIEKFADATLALRAIGKAEVMPDAALALLDSVSFLFSLLLNIDPPLMFKMSIADTFQYMKAVNDFLEAIALWELQMHEGTLLAIENNFDAAVTRFASTSDDARMTQANLLLNLRFVSPMAKKVSQEPQRGASSKVEKTTDHSAKQLLRLVFTMVLWGGDRIGITHVRTVLAIKATKLFQGSCHTSVRDEAHELLAHFISYFASDYCSHSRLHVPDLAQMINCCKELKINDTYTWGAISDAAAKVQSSFQRSDRRWLTVKAGTVVPRRLRGINSGGGVLSFPLTSTNSPNEKGTFLLSDLARPVDTINPDNEEVTTTGGFSSMTSAGYSHLSVRETFMLTSQVASIGNAFTQKHSGDKALYERFLFDQQIISPASDETFDGSSSRAPQGFRFPIGFGEETDFGINRTRKEICLDLLHACVTLCSPVSCPLPAQGPRRRLFLACVARSYLDLGLLSPEELATFSSKFEYLLGGSSKVHYDNDDLITIPLTSTFDNGLRSHVLSLLATLKVRRAGI